MEKRIQGPYNVPPMSDNNNKIKELRLNERKGLTSKTSRDNKLGLYQEQEGVQRYQADESKGDRGKKDAAVEETVSSFS
jgi:hypothetical protein